MGGGPGGGGGGNDVFESTTGFGGAGGGGGKGIDAGTAQSPTEVSSPKAGKGGGGGGGGGTDKVASSISDFDVDAASLEEVGNGILGPTVY